VLALALPRRPCHAEGIQHAGHRADEAHGQQHQVGLVFLLGAGDLAHLAVLPLEVDGLQAGDLALAADELLGRDGELAVQPSSWLELVRSLIGQ
jgi:hypothetical protein